MEIGGCTAKWDDIDLRTVMAERHWRRGRVLTQRKGRVYEISSNFKKHHNLIILAICRRCAEVLKLRRERRSV